jgi:transposase
MAKMVVAALKEEKTIAELSFHYEAYRSQITKWRKRVQDSLLEIFQGKGNKSCKDNGKLIDELYRQIGQLTVEKE